MDLNLLSAEEARLLDQKIAQSEHIVIVAHSRPDGDAVGSSLGWGDYLVSHYGKQPTVIVPNAFPDFLHWLPGCERIVRFDKHPDVVKAAFDEADLLFIMDLNQLLRTEEMETVLAACKADRVLMDHHLGPDIDTFLCISHPDLSSTSEVVFRVVWQLGGFDELSSKFAAPIYCGMMTDTGGFTYNSTRPEIFFIISQLLTKGIDKDKIYRNVFNNYSQWAIRLRGYLMSQRLNVFEDIHASYYTLTRQDMHNYHYMRGDGEGLSPCGGLA